MDQGSYEEQLRRVFDDFDGAGRGALGADELADLCLALQLEDAAPALLDALLRDQDQSTCRVDFDQFKSALILVLSSDLQAPPEPPPESAQIQPKFVKGAKRYGRRSAPEFIEPPPDSDGARDPGSPGGQRVESDESAVPRKRERWHAHQTGTEEFEAEGQMHLWNPDGPGTPCGVTARLEERLRDACAHLDICWDGRAGPLELLALCQHLSLEVHADLVQNMDPEDLTSVQEFVSNLLNRSTPPTPSAATPYRQLKRLHSTQGFNDKGRRTANPSALTCSIGTRLFSALDDGTGCAAVELLVGAWLDEGIENSGEILQALNLDLDGKLSLGDLTVALENELLGSKNGIHQAAAASFKAEIRYLLGCVETEQREKEKLRSDLDKAEKLKTRLALEVDERHASIEQAHSHNLRKLEQEHREKLGMVRAQLSRELETVHQQAALQREELQAELQKFRGEEAFLRDHLSVTLKENRRLEKETLESSERITELQGHVSKLQTSLDSVLMEKFGDLDPSSAEFLQQEERVRQLRSSYDARCRELQDRIDELQAELQDLHALAPAQTSCHRPLSEELESQSPGMESDPGLGPEDVHPLSLSLEAEMKLEQLREQHGQEMALLRNQLENKINELSRTLESVTSPGDPPPSQEELQSALEQAALERTCWEQSQEEVKDLRQQLLEVRSQNAAREEQLKTLQLQKVAVDRSMELQRDMASMESAFKEKMAALEEDKKVMEKEVALLQQNHEAELQTRLEEAGSRLEEEHGRVVQELRNQWTVEKAQLEEQSEQLLQGLLEDAMMKLELEQEEKEKQWESEKVELLQQHREAVLQVQEQLKLEQEKVRLQLEEDYEGMLQERLGEERERFQGELEEERARLEEGHREVLQSLASKHSEERNSLSLALRKLREDIAEERKEMESSFSQRLKIVEERFSGEQESAELRFRADVLRLEEHYQSELKLLCEGHGQEKHRWEAETQEALQISEERRRTMEALEPGSGRPGWDGVEALLRSNQQLQEDKDHLIHVAQTKELELGRQLNHLHQRLQQSLQNQEELLARSIHKRVETELLLKRTVEDFQREREELQLKYGQMLALSEHLNLRVEELELLLQQAGQDFELERQELQECVSELEERLRDRTSAADGQTLEMESPELNRGPNDTGALSLEKVLMACSPESWEGGEPPQDGGLGTRSASHGKQPGEEPMAEPAVPGETGGPRRPSAEDVASDSQDLAEESSLCEEETTEPGGSSHDGVGESEEPQTPGHTEENLLLQEKVLLLEQNNTVLQNILALKNQKLRRAQQAVEDSYRLRVKMLLLTEHVRVLEVQALQVTRLQIRLEDCLCENVQLQEQNAELERRVWSLEGGASAPPAGHGLKVPQVPPDHCPGLGQASQTLSWKSSQLSEENRTLRRRTVALQEEQEALRRAQEELQEQKTASQRALESFTCQVSELRLQSQDLERQNLVLSERNARDAAEMEALKLQLRRVREEQVQRQTLEEQKGGSRKTRTEKVKPQGESLQALHRQNARLKAELSATQQQRDALRHDVALLNKRLQSGAEKASPQGQSRRAGLKPRREAKPGVPKRQEEEKASRPDPPSLEHQAALAALEQENAALKQRLETWPELRELDELRQENQQLKEQLSRANAQAIDAFQSHLLGLLPPDPRGPPGPPAEEPEIVQDQRRKEAETSLRNLKLMLKEKAAQLSEQVQRNGQAGLLIGSLHAENAALLKVLESTELRLLHLLYEARRSSSDDGPEEHKVPPAGAQSRVSVPPALFERHLSLSREINSYLTET